MLPLFFVLSLTLRRVSLNFHVFLFPIISSTVCSYILNTIPSLLPNAMPTSYGPTTHSKYSLPSVTTFSTSYFIRSRYSLRMISNSTTVPAPRPTSCAPGTTLHHLATSPSRSSVPMHVPCRRPIWASPPVPLYAICRFQFSTR